MPTTGDDVDHAEQLAAHADRDREAWKRTLEDMEAIAGEHEDAGWETVTVAAGHTAPKPRDAGETDEYGLVHVVPGNRAEAIAAACDGGTFPRYEVYRGSTETRVFLVTELLDPDAETALLVAGNFRRYDARGLVRTVHETGRMYTHLRTLDGTGLGSFEHDEPAKFFPPADVAAHDPTSGE